MLPSRKDPPPSPDLVVAAVDPASVWPAHRVTSPLEPVPAPTLLVVEEPFAELAGVLWFGAHGIVLDAASDDELSDAARLVAQRCTVIAESVLDDERLGASRPALAWAVDQDAATALDALSEREREVLALIGTGRNNAEIAARLWVSSNTVRSHVQRLMRKLGMRNRLCLVVLAQELGLVDPHDTVLSDE
ncbi:MULTISPECIES: helix-turn-helix transcriptional regulator [unclassified Streptomyces]|uniref:helix-turn-helix transcriptional regulator n=1 Tax=unclassified Streptomyces TaxID=2593676 RepID=UPI002E19F812|nr:MULTISPECIES: response regulator transcription factor [unclassified Streptomyces]